ncbi:uncharacterized protein LOC144205989 [Stigmatopora nigra]
MEKLQTIPTDEDVKWDKMLDNILKSADTILWGTSPATATTATTAATTTAAGPTPDPPVLKEEPQAIPTTPPVAEPQVVMDLLPVASGGQPPMEGESPDVEDELANVLDDFWLPDYLGGQPGSVNPRDQEDNAMGMPLHDGLNEPLRLKDEATCGASSDTIETTPDPLLSIDSSDGNSSSHCYGLGLPDSDRPYVKKPPNAFMLFRKEQSPNVVAQFNITNSAVVNKILGRMWKSMPKKLQAKYYQQAEEHKILHGLQHPDWSCTENYGKKRKRDRSRHPTCNSKSTEDLASAVERHCPAMSQGAGEVSSSSSRHYHHKNMVGDAKAYGHTRGC